METLNWKNLIVSTGDAEQGTELGSLVENDDTSLLAVTVENGRISTYPQNYLSAPGEEASWNTPGVQIDWTGFTDALAGVKERLGA